MALSNVSLILNFVVVSWGQDIMSYLHLSLCIVLKIYNYAG